MRQIVWGLLAAGLISTTAMAQELPTGSNLRLPLRSAFAALAEQAATAAPEAAPKVTVTGAFDFPTLYVFRGIRQETDPALTFQPFVNAAFAAGDKVILNVGSWNSFHSGSNKDIYDSAFYETDFYASAAIATGGKVNPTIQYTAYTSPPENGFYTVHELAFILAVDDSKGRAPMAPAVTLAFEMGDHGADGGVSKGVYLELAAAPAISMKAVSLSIPVKLGLSLKDYYENPLTGEDSAFGFFSIGLAGTGRLGEHLDLHGSVVVYALGDTTKFFNNDSSSEVVGTIGLGFTFKK